MVICFETADLLPDNSDVSKQITVSEKVSFHVKTQIFAIVILLRENCLGEKLCSSSLLMEQGLVTESLFVSEKQSFCVKGLFPQNIILFRKVPNIETAHLDHELATESDASEKQ
jgi:hypothetical protein